MVESQNRWDVIVEIYFIKGSFHCNITIRVTQYELSIPTLSMLNLRTSIILQNEQSEKSRILYPFLDM